MHCGALWSKHIGLRPSILLHLAVPSDLSSKRINRVNLFVTTWIDLKSLAAAKLWSKPRKENIPNSIHLGLGGVAIPNHYIISKVLGRTGGFERDTMH